MWSFGLKSLFYANRLEFVMSSHKLKRKNTHNRDLKQFEICYFNTL